MEGGRAGNRVSIEFGSHFQRFGRELGELDGGVKELKAPPPPEGWQYWGGENDGEVRMPLRFERLAVSRGSGPSEPTEVRLKWLKCRTRVSEDGAVILMAQLDKAADSDALTARVSGWSLLPEAASGKLRLTLKDWQEAVIATRECYWTLPASGEKHELRLPVSLPADKNFLEAAFDFEYGGDKRAEATATYTRPLELAGDAFLRPDLPWGMGVYLYRYPNSPEGLAQMRRAAEMARDAGVKWSREEFSWSRIEPRRGEFDFEFYDQVVDTALEHGISVYGLLAYWTSWTQAYTEEGIEDFCAYARATVLHFKDRIKHWEVYNEPNIFFWSGPKELYPVLLEHCYAAIKEEDPEAEVLGISTAGVAMDFIRDCMEAGARFDILTIHPYRSALTERGFTRELREATQLVGNRPVWITEMGWSTQLGGVTSERRQAGLLARSYLLAVASGACQNISWYDFRCDGPNPFYNEHNFGVIRPDMTPKPAYRALASVARTMVDGEPEAFSLSPALRGMRMGDTAALWSWGGFYRAELALEGPESIVVKNLMGETLAIMVGGGSVELVLSPEAPVFVSGASAIAVVGEPAKLEKTIAHPPITG